MGGKGEGLGSRLILSLSYIRVILTFSTVITTSFPSLLPTSNSPKIASNLVCFGPWGYREPWKQWAAVTTHFLSITDPPHTANLGLPSVTHLKYTCQGNSPGLASLPPTIRDFFPIPQLMLPCPPCGSPPPHDQIVGFSPSFSSDSPPATGLPPRMMVRFTNIFNHSYCWTVYRSFVELNAVSDLSRWTMPLLGGAAVIRPSLYRALVDYRISKGSWGKPMRKQTLILK